MVGYRCPRHRDRQRRGTGPGWKFPGPAQRHRCRRGDAERPGHCARRLERGSRRQRRASPGGQRGPGRGVGCVAARDSPRRGGSRREDACFPDHCRDLGHRVVAGMDRARGGIAHRSVLGSRRERLVDQPARRHHGRSGHQHRSHRNRVRPARHCCSAGRRAHRDRRPGGDPDGVHSVQRADPPVGPEARGGRRLLRCRCRSRSALGRARHGTRRGVSPRRGRPGARSGVARTTDPPVGGTRLTHPSRVGGGLGGTGRHLDHRGAGGPHVRRHRSGRSRRGRGSSSVDTRRHGTHRFGSGDDGPLRRSRRGLLRQHCLDRRCRSRQRLRPESPGWQTGGCGGGHRPST